MKRQKFTKSFVAQARLNPENPDEAAALEVLEAWINRGHSMRAVITEALNSLGGKSIPQPHKRPAPGVNLEPVENMLDKRMTEMDKVVRQLAQIVDDLQGAIVRGGAGEQSSKLNREVGEISDRLKQAMYANADFGDDDG